MTRRRRSATRERADQAVSGHDLDHPVSSSMSSGQVPDRVVQLGADRGPVVVDLAHARGADHPQGKPAVGEHVPDLLGVAWMRRVFVDMAALYPPPA